MAGAQVREREVAGGQPTRDGGNHCGHRRVCRREEAVRARSLFDEGGARPDRGRECRDIDTCNGGETDRAVRRGGGQGCGSALGDLAAVVDDDYAVRQTLGLGELVGGEQDGEPAVAAGRDELAHHEAALGIDPRGRLVEEEDLGPTDQGERERQSLLLAAGEPPVRGATHGGQADPVDQVGRVLGVVVVGGEQLEHPSGTEHRIDASSLEHHPDASHDRGVVAPGIEPEHPGGAPCDRPVSLERFDGTGLARTVRSEQCDHLAGLRTEGETADRDGGAVADDHLVTDDGGFGHGSPRYRCADMIDIRLVRDDLDAVKQGLGRRGVSADEIDRLAALDRDARVAAGRRDGLRAEVKALSKQVGEARRTGDLDRADELAARSRSAGEEERAADEVAGRLQGEVRNALLYLPNLPSAEAPDGAGPEDNPVVRTWPDVSPTYGHAQRVPHWEVGTLLGILDMERGAKLSGSMFPLYRGLGARLLRALTSFALDSHSDEFEEIRPPTMVLTETMVSTGQLPKFEEDAYHLERDDLWAIPTAEVPLTSMWRSEILDESDLPLRLTAGTACYRREAGSAGRDTRGLLRVHEFDKVELFAYATPEQASEVHASLVDRAEELLRRLGLQYRVIDLCTGDLGNSAARTFDLEVYAPGVDQWLEVSSVSWFGDYQARRANVRYRPTGGGSPRFVHTLNGSALAWARIWAAIVETGRQADGSVVLPEVLGPYLGGELVIPARS